MKIVPNVPEHLEEIEGNTKSSIPGGRVANPAKRWCFTIFEFKESWKEDICAMFQKNDSYIFGFEICPKSGNKHLQGYVEFAKKERPLIRWRKMFPGVHIEKAKSNRKINITYCSKDGDIVKRGFLDDDEVDKWCDKVAVRIWWEDYKLEKEIMPGCHRLVFQQAFWEAVFLEKKFTCPPNVSALRAFMEVFYHRLEYSTVPVWWDGVDKKSWMLMIK